MSAAPETVPKLLTAEDVLDRMGQGRWELVRGEVRELMPTGWEHGDCTESLAFALGAHVRAHRLGRVLAAETGFVIARNPDTVRAADVSFISRGKLPERTPKGWVTVVPDLVVEVVSPSDRQSEVQEKIQGWLGFGIPLVWVVYPASQTVHVYRAGRETVVLTEADTLDGEDVIPGFSLPVREIF